ncbi:unnamed protein product [Cylicocyclus nassatus]|uniref:Uncharacterized protein n=1 Tax=Cylicocyclus nassatus TaxID=53992 RepID=A0AA36H764_CYLNA|nr:unnamed protein product [Cylicocyclus nassatus]
MVRKSSLPTSLLNRYVRFVDFLDYVHFGIADFVEETRQRFGKLLCILLTVTVIFVAVTIVISIIICIVLAVQHKKEETSDAATTQTSGIYTTDLPSFATTQSSDRGISTTTVKSTTTAGSEITTNSPSSSKKTSTTKTTTRASTATTTIHASTANLTNSPTARSSTSASILTTAKSTTNATKPVSTTKPPAKKFGDVFGDMVADFSKFSMKAEDIFSSGDNPSPPGGENVIDHINNATDKNNTANCLLFLTGSKEEKPVWMIDPIYNYTRIVIISLQGADFTNNVNITRGFSRNVDLEHFNESDIQAVYDEIIRGFKRSWTYTYLNEYIEYQYV